MGRGQDLRQGCDEGSKVHPKGQGRRLETSCSIWAQRPSRKKQVHGHPGGRARDRGERLALLLQHPGRDCQPPCQAEMGLLGPWAGVEGDLSSIIACEFPRNPDISKGNLLELLFPPLSIATQKMWLLLSFTLLLLQKQHWYGQIELPSFNSCWTLSSGFTLRQDTKKSGLKAESLFGKQQLRSPAEFLPVCFLFIWEEKNKLLHQLSESRWVSDLVWNPHCTNFSSNSGIDFNIFFHLLSSYT